MHRFEAAQHLGRPDARQYSSNPGSVNNNNGYNRGGGDAMPSYHIANKSCPPGSNPRAIAHLFPSHSSPGNSMEGNCSFPPHSNSRNNIPHYHQGVGGMEMGYFAQKRSGPMMAQYGGPSVLAPSPSPGAIGFSSDGYGAVGGNRYHPYYNHPQQQQQQQQPPPAQPQQQKAGFLEQLLKSRGKHQSGYQPFYARSSSSLGTSNWPCSNSGLNQSQYNQGSHRVYPDMGYGGASGCYSSTPHAHQQQQQQHNWGRGIGYGGYQSHPNNSNRGSFHNQNVPAKHPFHQARGNNLHHQQHNLPIIKNEPEEEGVPTAEEQADAEIIKSETRYRRNHERMFTIMNDTMTNCEPIQVPMSRVDSLRRHVRCLKDDVNKHKDDSEIVKDRCAKRLQDFKDSTAKFHADYRKLCQPIAEEEYNALVDKYYKELKEKLQQKQVNGSTSTDNVGYDEAAADEGIDAADEVVFGVNDSKAEVGPDINNMNKNELQVLPPRDVDNYFDDALFIDIPPEREILPPQQQMYQNAFPTPHTMGQEMGSTCGAVGGNLYYEGQQQQQQQHQLVEGKYYPSAGESEHLLMAAQPPHGGMRWQHHHHHQPPNDVGHPQGYPHTRGAAMRHQIQQSHNNKQVRPSEELREFLLGLVQAKFRNNQQMTHHHHPHQVPQLQQEADPVAADQQEDQHEEGQERLQHRRLMSGGGIVEVKHSPPYPSQTQPTFYDDVATREWINSLTSSAVAEGSSDVGDTIVGDANRDEEEEEDVFGEAGENEDHNNNMERSSSIVGETLSINDIENEDAIDCSTSAKNSKIAELLGTPCLNENNAEEFDLELRQLEDALNGNSVPERQKAVDDHAEDDDDDREENQDGIVDEQLHQD